MRSFTSALSLSAVFTAIACSDSSGPKAGPPANLGVVNQASLNQTAVIGTATSLPLSVVVSDASSRPLSGVLVTFAVATGGGTLSATTQTTDANGVASVTWTLGNTFGIKTVTASVTGLPVVAFNTIAIAPDAGVLAFNLVDPANDTIPPPADTGTYAKGIDVLSVQGIFKRDSLIVTITFARPVEFGSGQDALVGYLEFDIDDNAATGQPVYSNFFGASANAAIEYVVLMYGETGTSIYGVLDYRPNVLTAVSASYPANSLVVRIPMRLLGDDDGNFTIVGVVGNDRPTDFFPNSGSSLVRRSLGTSFTMRSSRLTAREAPPFTWSSLSRRHSPVR
ncbi:MAG TPA: hypothetical protein VIF83_11185 [Gemmatimonadaceae bacterium]